MQINLHLSEPLTLLQLNVVTVDVSAWHGEKRVVGACESEYGGMRE